MPLNKLWSLDVYLKIIKRDELIPGWNLELLKAQTFLMLFFSGIVKLNIDWLSGNTLDIFFSYFPENNLVLLYYDLFGKHTTSIIAWGTVLLEIILPILLYIRSTRYVAFTLLSLFLLQNSYILQIGIFPYLSMLCLSLFFIKYQAQQIQTGPFVITKQILIVFYLVVQICLPLRIFLKSDYLWTGTYQTQFAWNMFLAMPKGHIHYLVCRQEECISVNPTDYGITLEQKKKMISNPLSIYQFGHFLCLNYPKHNVYVKSWLSINRRPLSPYYNTQIDICQCSKFDSDKDLIKN